MDYEDNSRSVLDPLALAKKEGAGTDTISLATPDGKTLIRAAKKQWAKAW
jgi:hypothetical protein